MARLGMARLGTAWQAKRESATKASGSHNIGIAKQNTALHSKAFK